MIDQQLKIGIIGEYDPQRLSHVATGDALHHAAQALTLPLKVSWVATPTLEGANYETVLPQYNALWCAPGIPYESMEGALAAIRYARERDVPLLGT